MPAVIISANGQPGMSLTTFVSTAAESVLKRQNMKSLIGLRGDSNRRQELVTGQVSGVDGWSGHR